MKRTALCFLLIVLQFAARAETVEKYGVFEGSLKSSEKFDNPFTQAQLRGKFTGPDGKAVDVAGFYYQNDEWKIRFVPNQVGEWSYALELTSKGEPVRAAGKFDCADSKRHGFLRVSKINPYRLAYDDGTPFYPIGQQVGCGVGEKVGFDAPDEKAWVNTDRETFMKAFTGATNLLRSQLGCGTAAGCALQILNGKDGLDRYELDNALKLDESCRVLQQFGWSHILIPFQDMSLWGKSKTAFGDVRDVESYKTLKNPQLPEIERYLRYVVARWGSYVDIWEIYNEDAFSPNDYLAHLAKIIREADPYAHPITTSYERPDQPWCDLLSVHEYMGNPTNEVPGHLSKEIARFKSYNKPVLYTEFGNQAKYSNDDPVKWRVAVWTAFMNECSIGFWNMSGRRTIPKDKGGPVNAYLGEESRKHFKILADFTRELPLTLRPVTPGFTSEQPVQSWALGNDKLTVMYLHHFRGYEPVTIKDKLHIFTGPGKFHVKWIDPASGNAIRENDLSTKGYALEVELPEFSIDLAARIDKSE
jgi:hypothetical protein